MKPIFLKSALLLCITLALLSLIYSCQEPDILGLEVQPAGDKLNVVYTDTISLYAHSVKEDSIRADETAYNLLGYCDDPVFGKNTAGFYTQLRLSYNNVNFGDSPQPDSIFLSLTYKKVYGDTNAQQTVKVYRLAEDIHSDSSYYSNREFLTTGELLGSKTFVPKPHDSLYLDGDTTVSYAPQLRIKLSHQFALELLYAGSTALSDNTNFTNFFKGIYVTATSASGEGSIMTFDLLNAQSKITLYYSNSTTDSAKYNFVINENCARINHFNHSRYQYADPYLRSELTNDTLKGDSILYIQAMAGLKVRITYPYIMDLVKAGRIAINNANLIVGLDNNDYTTGTYIPPAQLVLLEEKDGKIRFLQDQYDGATYYGGTYNASKKEYSFNIARHIQQVIDGLKENLGLYLVVWTANRPNTANRVVLKGTKRQSGNLRLQITYTKLY